MKKRNLLHIVVLFVIAAITVTACSRDMETAPESSEIVVMTTERSAEIETKVTTELETSETAVEITAKPVAEIENTEDIAYRITKSRSEGESSDRGYYVFNMPDSDLRYVVIISSDDGSENGYDFDVTDVKFDGFILKITVEEKELDSVFEKGSWPCTSVEIDKFPDDVIVLTTDNEVLDRIYVYMREEDISDDYTAVFYSDLQSEDIYVYELEDGRYKWIALSSLGDISSIDPEKYITGFGLVENKEELKELVRDYSCRIFTYPGETDYHTTDEF